jgi:nitroreductase
VSAISTLLEMVSIDIDAEFEMILEYSKHPTTTTLSEDVPGRAFEDLVRSRRSIRVFAPGIRVPEGTITAALDLAMLAPNSSNLQPWEFYWVRTPDKKAELVRLCMSQPPARTASDLIVFVARTATWRRNCDAIRSQLETDPMAPTGALKYYRLAAPLMYTQAANILSAFKHVLFNVQGLRKPMPREPNFEWGMQMWATKSVCLAASIFMLAMRAYGYDSCPMEGCDQHRIKKLLRLPRDARVCMVMGVGQRASTGVYGERLRLDRSWFVKEV